jgi:[ribosomal protein S18]-alanine N-acetyltransferase
VSALVSSAAPRLRPMRETDLERVIDIELKAYDFPWTLGIFRDCLRYGYICMVFENDEALLGYGILSLGAGECHLLNICIAPAFQGRGHGTQLIDGLLDLARTQAAKMAFLEVRASNLAAYRVYTKMGFNELGVRKNYYPAYNGREDAILLAREL